MDNTENEEMIFIRGEDGKFKAYDPFIEVSFETEKDYQFMKNAVKEKLEREQNPPLTIDELKNMIGKPIWVNYDGGGYYGLMTSQGLLCPNGQFKNYEILKMWELYKYEIKGE